MKKLEKTSILVIVLLMVMGVFAHGQQTIPPAQGLPNLTIVGNGGVDLSVKTVAINCDLPPITLKLIGGGACPYELEHKLPPSRPNHFPQNAIIVESDGEYDISYLSLSPVSDLLIESSGISIDIVRETQNDILELVGKIKENDDPETKQQKLDAILMKISGRFWGIAEKECPQSNRNEGSPCTGFDVAVGGERIRQDKKDPKPECGESDYNASYCPLVKGSVYYVRPTWIVQNPYAVCPDHGQLWVNRRCCSQTRYAWGSQTPLGEPSTSSVPTSLGCPCQTNPDSTSRKMLRTIYANEILSPRHGKIQLFEVTLSGDRSYKFSFDPRFDGQFVFYKFGAPDDYNTFSIIANQSFNGSDGQTDIMLNNLGDCSTVYVALAVEPCAAGDLPITVGPAN